MHTCTQVCTSPVVNGSNFVALLQGRVKCNTSDTNDIVNTNQAQYRSDRQEILTAWQKDTPIKMSDNRQVLDNLEAYV